MYPTTVQRTQADGSVRSFMKSNGDASCRGLDYCSAPDFEEQLLGNSNATTSTGRGASAALAIPSDADGEGGHKSNKGTFQGVPEEQMDLQMLSQVLMKIPSIKEMQEWLWTTSASGSSILR